jgi:hypothetical protein
MKATMRNHPSLKLNDVTAKITGKRFCSHHLGEVLTEAGSFIQGRTATRFVCYRCQEKIKQRIAEIKIKKKHIHG